MSTAFSMMVKQIVSESSADSIPNPARSGYFCKPSKFLSELIRFVSMMQVMKVGVSSEIASIKNDLEIANQSPVITRSDNRLYALMVKAIDRICKVCIAEGTAAENGRERELAETYAWSVAGCNMFLQYSESIGH